MQMNLERYAPVVQWSGRCSFEAETRVRSPFGVLDMEPDIDNELTDFSESTPVIGQGSMKDLEMEVLGFERMPSWIKNHGEGEEIQGIYELWFKNGMFVYRNVRGYYSMVGRAGKQKRMYFENEDHILNYVNQSSAELVLFL